MVLTPLLSLSNFPFFTFIIFFFFLLHGILVISVGASKTYNRVWLSAEKEGNTYELNVLFKVLHSSLHFILHLAFV